MYQFPLPINSPNLPQPYDFYFCPGKGVQNYKCMSPEDFFCPYLSYVTIATYWGPNSTWHLTLQRLPSPAGCSKCSCNPIQIHLTNPNSYIWTGGFTWGIWLYIEGWDKDTLFTIQCKYYESLVQPNPVGPFLV